MRTIELKNKASSSLFLGRLESLDYSTIGSIKYNFFGGPVHINSDFNKDKWGNFSIAKSYKLNNDKDFLQAVNIEIGDIVQFNPRGASVVIYEKQSTSNAFFLTERCNSKCVICPQPPKNNYDYTNISIATAELINDETTSIGITGGEPTMAWDGLIRLISKLLVIQPNVTIELLTNARALHQYEKAKELAATTINSQLITCIPLYSDIDKIHDFIVGCKGAFWQTVEGIYNLERFKIPVELRLVVVKQNYERLGRWAEFVYRHFPFVKHVAIMALEPFGNAIKNIEMVWIDPLDYSDQLGFAVKTFFRRDMDVSIYNHQLCTIPKHLWNNCKKSISEWKNIYFGTCSNCTVKQLCGGFFKSASAKHSSGIKPVPSNA
jgi:His-Xaa-Ser system radical SAM maturase HxsC